MDRARTDDCINKWNKRISDSMSHRRPSAVDSLLRHEDCVALSFRTRARRNEKIETVHNELMYYITTVPGFQQIDSEQSIQIVRKRKGKIELMLTHASEWSVGAVIRLLESDDRVKQINLDAMDVAVEDLDVSNGWTSNCEKKNDNFRLTFDTILRREENIDEYHEELIEKLMKVDGFTDKCLSFEDTIITDDKGKMSFILSNSQSENTFIEDPAIRNVLVLLRKERRVDNILMRASDEEISQSKDEKATARERLRQHSRNNVLERAEQQRLISIHKQMELEQQTIDKKQNMERVYHRNQLSKQKEVQFHNADISTDPAKGILRQHSYTKKKKQQSGRKRQKSMRKSKSRRKSSRKSKSRRKSMRKSKSPRKSMRKSKSKRRKSRRKKKSVCC